MCTPLPVRSPRRLARRLANRVSGILFAPDIHEGVITSSIFVGFTDVQQEGGVIDQDSTIICDGPLYGSTHCGEGTWLGGCTSTNGG